MNIEWNPPGTVPRDGTEVLLWTKSGFVSAWFANEPPSEPSGDDGSYDWVCFDGEFYLDGHSDGLLGWAQLPKPVVPKPTIGFMLGNHTFITYESLEEAQFSAPSIKPENAERLEMAFIRNDERGKKYPSLHRENKESGADFIKRSLEHFTEQLHG